MSELRLEGVGRTYAEEPPVVALHDVSLLIRRGEFIAIQGPSGSGKSTLLNIIALMDRPTSGTYAIDGDDSAALDERDRAWVRSVKFGFIFQSFHLVARRSALENAALGLLYRGLGNRERHDRAARSLAALGLAHRGEQAASKLSGGERQRVAIARATVGGAPIIIADEPTGNLDSATTREIVTRLRQLHRRGTTIVLVTHDPDVAAAADRVVTLRDGTIVHDRPTASPHVAREVAPDPPRRPCAPPRAQRARPGSPGRGERRASRLRLRDLEREARLAVLSQPGRSGALAGAVALAVALVVATTGLAQTASAQVSDLFDARRNREVVVTVPVDVAGQAGTPERASVTASQAEQRLRQVVGVTRIGALTVRDQQAVRPLSISAASPVTLSGVSPGLLRAAGARVDWVSGQHAILGPRELLVGSVAARQLELSSLSNDPAVLVDGVPFAVVGTIRSGGRVPELLTTLVARERDASTFGDPNDVRVLITTVPGAAQQVARQAPIALDPVAPDRFEVRAPPDPSSLRAAIQSDLATTLLAFTIVAAFASMLGVANAMMVGVIERTGEMGLRRAIGARPVHILNQVAVEALLIGLAGGAAGFMIGSTSVLAITVAKHWQPVLDLRIVPVALAGGALVGVLGGLAAAVRASRIQPAEALRR